MASEDENEDENRRNPADQILLLKSYLAFAVRAVRTRWVWVLVTFVVVFGSCLAVLPLLPRSYRCESTIMIQGSGMLFGGDGNAFRGAREVVLRRENLVKIVRDTDLIRRSTTDRQLAQRLKVRLLGTPDPRPQDLEAALVWTLESALWVQPGNDKLMFGIEWGNAEMAARLVAAAQKVYLQERHVAEVSTIQEKMAIMEGHSSEVRKEIEGIAEELKGVREDKLAEIGKARNSAAAPSASAEPSSAPRFRITTPVMANPVSEEELSRRKEAVAALTEQLEEKKRQLKDLESQRNQNLTVAQTQLAELLTRFTPAHPSVRRLEMTIESLSQDSPQAAPLKEAIAALGDKIKQEGGTPDASRGTIRRSGGSGASSVTATSGSPADALPAEILMLLESGTQADPAVTVQLQGAISKYAGLRDGIRTARVDLDTAQAAFNHRYKIYSPPEPPQKPSKPDVRLIGLLGFAVAAFLALLLPLIAELRRGVIVERWQVSQMQLPILGELRLPSGPND